MPGATIVPGVSGSIAASKQDGGKASSSEYFSFLCILLMSLL